MENKSFWEKQRSTIIFLVVLLISLRLTTMFIMEPVHIDGKAMSPTLNNGDFILANKIFNKIDRGEIVVYRYPKMPSIRIIERILGLPGASIESNEGNIYINGSVINEPYLSKENSKTIIEGETIKI